MGSPSSAGSAPAPLKGTRIREIRGEKSPEWKQQPEPGGVPSPHSSRRESSWPGAARSASKSLCPPRPWQPPSPVLKTLNPTAGLWCQLRGAGQEPEPAAAPAQPQVGRRGTARSRSRAGTANIWLHFVVSVDAVHRDAEHPHLPLHLSPLRILAAAPCFRLLYFIGFALKSGL